MNDLKATVDPYIFIEQEAPGFVVYRQLDDRGLVVRRWSVTGVCDRRGYCMLGAIVDGKELTVQDILDGRTGERLQTHMDVPVTPEFKDCCPFTFEELECH